MRYLEHISNLSFRVTGLKDGTRIVAYPVEAYGVSELFFAKEMAFNVILGLMHPLLFSITQVEPIWVDLSGGMDCPPDPAEQHEQAASRSKLEIKVKTCDYGRQFCRRSSMAVRVNASSEQSM